jgi:transcriptional regulator with GAF, ATPase, and Fis domain
MAVTTGGLERALRQLANLSASPVTLEAALQRIIESADALFQVDGAALLLVDSDQALRSLAVSDERAARLEELQRAHNEGPAVTAFDERRVVGSGDLGADDRWPRFGPAAVDAGLVAVLASPIPYADDAVGVIAVLDAARHDWAEPEREALVAFTELAALLIRGALEARERGRLAGELSHALDSRVVIEQAKGVLVGRHGLTPRAAFERLRQQARDERRPLAEVAAGVVAAAQRA